MMLTISSGNSRNSRSSPTGGGDVPDDTEFRHCVQKTYRQDDEEDTVDTFCDESAGQHVFSEIKDLLHITGNDDDTDDYTEASEYVEEMEPTAAEAPEKQKWDTDVEKRDYRSRKLKKEPDYKWQNNSRDAAAPKARSRRGKLSRTKSFDMMDYSKTSEEKGLSWDRGNRPKPDFRWDKFIDLESRDAMVVNIEKKINVRNEDNDNDISKSSHSKTDQDKPSRRKRIPRRTKSDITSYDMPGRVRFCFRSTVCVEVPRPTKDMEPDLYYTKKEIKVFKAERKEEKAERRQERQNAKSAATNASAGAILPR